MFVHDRVHEAAYSLIPEGSRAEAHLRIGRLLAAQTPPEKREEAIFEIVGQLNRGSALITEQKEREQLAEFNLVAGLRAKASTAYASALTYLVKGAELMTDDCWERRHGQIFALELNRAECEFLTGQVSTADERLVVLAHRATTTVEKALVACLHMEVHLVLDRSDHAVAVCLAYLRHVGIEWSPHPNDDEVRREYEDLWSRLGDRTIEELVDLPLMEDAASLGTVQALGKLFAPAVHTDGNLACLTVCKAVSLSIERGNCDASCLLYANIGRVAGQRFGDYQAGYRFGRLGCDLVDRRGLKRFEASTFLCFSIFVERWMKPVRNCRALLTRAFAAANRIGDIPYGSYCCNSMNSDLLFAGEPLPELQAEAERGLAYVEKMRFGQVIDFITTQLALIRMLRGLSPSFGCIDDEQFNELRTEAHLSGNPALALAAGKYWVRKLQARYLAGDYTVAMDAASKAESLLWATSGFYEEAECHFFGALTHAALCGSAPAGEWPQHLDAMAVHHRQLQTWTENCPENFGSRTALVGAEIARIEGRMGDAEQLYEQAIRASQENGFVHIEALANELASRFYAARGLEKVARVYLQDARYGYLRWGANGKVWQLEQTYPYLRTEEPAPGPTSTIATPVEHLDLATVIKVSQAASGDIVLDKLIDMIMRTAIEQAGAERGLLILSDGGEPRVAAEAMTGGDATQLQLRDVPVSAETLPESILYHVLRTRESIFLDDAATEPSFAADPYVREHRARSILCLPLMNQAKLTGALYLENNLTARVFSPARIAVLKLVASQAAVSLENARLYRDIAEREAKIRRLVDAQVIEIKQAEEKVRESERRYRDVQTEMAHANRVATMGHLTASIAHEVKQPIAATVTNAQAGLRWLGAQPPNVEEARQLFSRIVNDGNRAVAVVGRIRELVKNALPQKEPLDINEAIHEVIELTRGEARKHGASVQTSLACQSPLIHGDRVQLQQVLLNLLINAMEAMSGVSDGVRELLISTGKADAGGVLVAVSDSGPGFASLNAERIFVPFYTTKSTGLGMGLSICRSIIEAHGGRLWASANVPRGAIFQFTVPAHPDVSS
jgi:signal transduction histidine kinase